MEKTDEYFYTIDAGVNFASKSYNETKVKNIIDESSVAVTEIITISNSLKEILVNQKMASKYKSLYYTAGVHPHDAKSIDNLNKLNIIKDYSNDPKCVAIGECGLDYNRMFSPKEKQQEVFIRQIQIAKESNKPLYMHCRDAFDDFTQILKEQGYFNGVIHCFTGSKSQAVVLIKMGFYFGITGWLLDKRRNGDLVNALEVIPDDKIIVETDAPWLSIDRSRESHPLDTGDIVFEIAKIKKVNDIKLGQQIYSNTKKFFGISHSN